MKVYELSESMVCYAQVAGNLQPLPKELDKSVRRYFSQRWITAKKAGIHIFRGEVYAVKPRFDWDKKEIGFLLFTTTFDRLLARWLKIDQRVVRGFKYITNPALPVVVDPETGEAFFILARINKNRLMGSSVNFVGGTMDQSHTSQIDPLQANLWAECNEEIGIRPQHVKKARYRFLVVTEGAYFLVSELLLKLSPSQLKMHFKEFTLQDKEKEVVGLIFVSATKTGVLNFLNQGYQIIEPVKEVLQVAVGLKQPDVPA